ncbi:MAG: signal peptidase I [Chloroflexota bacterium]|nr:signal peptidase I [Chloroflexota bacterium]
MFIMEATMWTGFGCGGISLPEIYSHSNHGSIAVHTSSQGRAWPAPSFRAARFPLHILRKGVRAALVGIFVSLLFNVFVAQAMVVHGPSMNPNLAYNQRVIVDKITCWFSHGPHRGNVVVVDMPGEQELLVKRVIALAGETVAVQDGRVFINGQPFEEPWATRLGGMDYPPTRVPSQHVFVLGDNREESRDSRFFGPVPVDRIGGRIRFVIWPLDRIGWIG